MSGNVMYNEIHVTMTVIKIITKIAIMDNRMLQQSTKWPIQEKKTTFI